MAGCAGLFVAREAQARNGAELGEVLAHLVLVEAMRDAAVGRIGLACGIRGLERGNENLPYVDDAGTIIGGFFGFGLGHICDSGSDQD